MFTLSTGRMPTVLLVASFFLGWLLLLMLLLDIYQPDFTAGQVDHGPSLTQLLALIVDSVFFVVLYLYLRLRAVVVDYTDAEREATASICAAPSVPSAIFTTAEARLLDRISGQRARQLMYVNKQAEYLADPEPDYSALAQQRSEQDYYADSQGN